MVDATLESGRQVRFRGGGFDPVSRSWVAWAFFALLLVLWEAAGRARLIDPLFLPPPSQIWQALEEMTLSGELARHLGASLGRIAAGWVIGTVAGVVLGGLIGLFGLGRSVGLPFISALFAAIGEMQPNGGEVVFTVMEPRPDGRLAFHNATWLERALLAWR